MAEGRDGDVGADLDLGPEDDEGADDGAGADFGVGAEIDRVGGEQDRARCDGTGAQAHLHQRLGLGELFRAVDAGGIVGRRLDGATDQAALAR